VRACELLPQGLDMDPAALAQLCSERTLAVVPTHLAGRVADVASARACAKAVGAKVFEDAAQALGATIQGRSVGADSDLAFFSLAVGKGLTLYEGGALYVRDAALREACRESAAALAPWRPTWELLRCLQLLAVGALYRPACLPWAYGWGLRRALHRDDWIGAAGEHFSTKIPLHRVGRWRRAVGRRALQRLPQFLARSRQQAALRIERLRRIAGLLVLDDSPAADRADGTWPVILLLLPDRERRDAVLRRMWAGGWGLSLPFVHALPDHPACAGAVMPVAADDLPNARDLAARLLAVSNSPWLGNAAFDVVCRELKSVLAGAEPVCDRSDLRFRAVAAGPAPPGR
jgi:dTDP-4-amino-4,6-dideoxygalactose transaminase